MVRLLVCYAPGTLFLMSAYTWSLRPAPEQTEIEAWQPKVSPLVATLLWQRGVRSFEEAETFLAPSWEGHTHDPAQFRHLPQAMALVFSALEAGDRITVHGDYDADGITGSTVLISTLQEIEKRLTGRERKDSVVDYYVPHRDKEGYGVHQATIGKLKDRGTKVLITVDCGISCVEEVALARKAGMDVIVVDHHQFGEILPDGWLIHPGLPEETYPFKKLAAVGVAFKFATALLGEARQRGLEIPSGWEKWLLDLVAIATITDVVPLIGENRVLETYGLRVLNKTRRPGLVALIDAAGLTPGSIDTESIGFAIGPRINAAGRMDHASLALRLLLAETQDEAQALAKELERCNRERQDATKVMMAEAEKQLMERYTMKELDAPEKSALFLWNESWSPALVGLVAGRFLERFARPTVVVGSHEGTWIGSGRSVSSYDITAAMRAAGEGRLTRIGGHIQACGFALKDPEHLPNIEKDLHAHAAEAFQAGRPTPTLLIDADLSLAEVNEAFIDQVKQLEPFGEGNAKPLFRSENLLVTKADTIGSTQAHLRLVVADGGLMRKVIGFKLGNRVSEIQVGARVDLVYHVSMNEWNGRKEVQLVLKDFAARP
jgi:single-stranded-DNA-specific exonuclease